jgi:hypothetical protein
VEMKSELIAPCGMNCNICKGHLREKNTCPGCRDPIGNCRKCIIRTCDVRKSSICDCEKIPCTRLKNLDKRYKTKYDMSMLENLDFIKNKGMKKFLEKEVEKWKCSKCSGIVSCHDGKCYGCGIVL